MVKIAGVVYILYHVISAELLLMPGLGSRFVHINGALLLTFLTLPMLKKESRWSPQEIVAAVVLAGLTLASWIYIHLMSPELMGGGIGRHYPLGIALGLVTLLLVLEANRRVMGWILPVIVIVCIFYARFGEIMPGIIMHVDFDFERINTLLYMGTDGLYGMIARVSFSYIALFIIYAQFLRTSGGGDFFLEFAYALFGGIRGGPAKVAVGASCLFGSISGSAVANVAGTGVVTIPLMKRTGYSPAFAAAVEAAASTGGQFMPPIMAAAAFLVADFLGVDYIDVALAAMIPAVLYYVAIYVMVDLRAVQLGLVGLPRQELPNLKKVLKKGYYHCISPVVLVYLLGVELWTPTRAAFWSLVVLLAVAALKREKKFFREVLWPSLTNSVSGVVMMGVVSGALGVIVGVFGLTGLALKLSGILIEVSGGNLLVLLVLTMLTSIFLGMGLPTIAAYVLLAMLVAPALEEIGVPLMAGHLFCLFFGILSVVTPPVCLASYTAATIAGSDPMRTGFIALRLSLAGFLLPYFFVYYPSLLLINPSWGIIWPLFTCVLGTVGLAVGLEGFFLRRLGMLSRILMVMASCALISPTLGTDLIGLLIFAAVLGPQVASHLSAKRSKTAQASGGLRRNQ